MKRVVTIYSGGMDSTVLLYHLMAEGYDVRAISIDYGQRHRKELESAHKICGTIGLPHEVADLRGITHLLGGSSLTDTKIDVPEGHYAAENMKATVVPNRNMIMLSVAIGYAITLAGPRSFVASLAVTFGRGTQRIAPAQSVIFATQTSSERMALAEAVSRPPKTLPRL